MDWHGKRTLVVGAGISGLAAATRLQDLGADVFLTDIKTLAELPAVKTLRLAENRLLLGREVRFSEINPELIVLSPGVPTDLPLIREAQANGVKIWGEVELALHDCPAYLIGVTGTNGKTTTTTLIGELVKRTGKPAVVAGNIGVPLSGQVGQMREGGIVVAELSSFQLEFFDQVRVNVAIILNITPDHLDRHKTLANYIEAKSRILKNQRENDVAVLNWNDPLVRGLEARTKARIVYFSSTGFIPEGVSLQRDQIVWAEKGRIVPVIDRRKLHLRGAHNLENVMASIVAAHEAGLGFAEIARGLAGFQGVPHRQEVVGRFDDILFINDSKGTNPEAALKALYAFDEPIVLIAGGKNKGLSFDGFMKAVKEKVKSLVLLGMAADLMEEAARKAGVERIVRAQSFPEGVEAAIAEAGPGDVVLLSPACTSWDMFRSYEERGELFKELVRTHYKKPK